MRRSRGGRGPKFHKVEYSRSNLLNSYNVTCGKFTGKKTWTLLQTQLSLPPPFPPPQKKKSGSGS